MIKATINLTKDRDFIRGAMFDGKNGKYLSLCLWENKDGPDQYGNDGFVTIDLGKERREAGEKSPIIGNWKGGSLQPVAAAKPANVPVDDSDEIPF